MSEVSEEATMSFGRYMILLLVSLVTIGVVSWWLDWAGLLVSVPTWVAETVGAGLGLICATSAALLARRR